MESSYDALLEATISHLTWLKARGIRRVPGSSECLNSLLAAKPAPRRAISKPQFKPDAAGTAAITTPWAETPPSPGSSRALPPPSVDAAMAALRERALVCQKCPPLVCSRKNVVFGVGDIRSPLMFVGEAPGADEDIAGEPFVGKAGQLLTKIIQTMGFSRQTVYIANVLKCRPDTPGQASGNRKPTAQEMNTCIPYLHEQIDLIKPKVIVALGGTAVEGLLGKGPVYITKLRGSFQTFRGIPLMPTYHPSYVLRNQGLATKRELWEDMLQVLDKIGVTISEKQRGYFLSPDASGPGKNFAKGPASSESSPDKEEDHS